MEKNQLKDKISEYLLSSGYALKSQITKYIRTYF